MLNAPFFTKIVPPQPRQVLSRPRLLADLERCRDYRLLLISANTGFGKTSLLTDYARRSGMALAWYGLDESDRDPAVFCRFLLHSVRQVYPSFGQSFEQLLEQNLNQLHQEAIVFRLAEEFIGNLEMLRQNSAEDFCETLLILDDFQFAESFGVNRFVQRLVWWLPDGFHLIVSTRVLPEDLMLTRLMAKQMMVALGPRDLAFTNDEVKQLLSEFYGINEPELAETLTTYSEGWITAVVLALSNYNQNLIRSEGWRTLRAGSFDADQLFSYLAQEVFQNQAASIQDFLLKTSVFDLIDPNSCDELLGAFEESTFEDNADSETTLKQLENSNLFITRLSSQGQTYFQYHRLFRQFLRSKLRQKKALYKKTQTLASQIQKAAGNSVEAVQHLIEAGEVSQAAALLNEIVESFYEAGRTQLLSDLMDSIPEQTQANLPHLISIKAKLLLEKGGNEAALKNYAVAEKLYRQEGKSDLAAMAQANQAQLQVRIGQRREALLLCNQLLRGYTELMQTLEGQKAVALVKVVLGSMAIEEGNSLEAEKNLREAIEIEKACADNFHLATIDGYFGQLYQHDGRLTKSNIYFERSLAYFVKTGNRGREAYLRVSLVINRYMQGQYHEAEEQLNEALILTRDLGDQYLRLFVLNYLGNVYRDTGRFAKADPVYEEALELAYEGRVRKMELALLNDQATAYILQAKKTEAEVLINRSLALAEDYNLPERAAFSHRNQGWLAFESGAYKRALASIEKALEIFGSTKARSEEARSKLSQAVILMRMGEPRKALTALTESLELVEELSYTPFLPFELQWAVPLLDYAKTKKVSEPVVEFLRKRGFLSGLPANTEVSDQAENSEAQSSLPEPIQFDLHRNPKRSNLFPQSNIVTVPAPFLRVEALNGGRIWREGIEIEQWRVAKSREALFYLLERKKCSRDELLDALWPEEDFGASPNSLHIAFSYLRKAIAPLEIKLSGGRYYLEAKAEKQIWYDADEFGLELKAALAAKELEAGRLTMALNLYKRDFLDQFYSNWSQERQQQLLQLYVSGLEKLARYYEKQGQPQNALPVWKQYLLKEPYNEEVHRAAIACWLAMGNKPEARRQSTQCLKALEEIDLQPSSETRLLLQKLA